MLPECTCPEIVGLISDLCPICLADYNRIQNESNKEIPMDIAVTNTYEEVAKEMFPSTPNYPTPNEITDLKKSSYDTNLGTKFDSGKPQMSMLPKEAMEQLANVFAYGANKYGRNNYKGGMNWSRLLDAAMRHLVAFNSGEDNDNESKLNHLAHCMANCAMLLHYQANKRGTDDR